MKMTQLSINILLISALMPHNTIRLAVVGDQGVGKTSLVCAIISDLPSSDLPHVHKKVVLPPDMCPYSKDVFTQIVDTGNDPRTQIKNSDLIMLVYDVSSEESIVRLNEHWLPIINTLTKDRAHPTPVVVVGNKSDKIDLPVDQERDHTTVKEVLKGLTRSFKQVQMGIECSARYDKNVKKVLNSSQRAVLYPLSPLYDLTQKKISNKFRKALLRIFRILDTSFSGVLNDRQLSALQERVFQTELSGQDIRAIKNIIQRQSEEQQTHSISVNGFIAFQKKCIQMLKIQICWNILKHFDYNNDIEIRDTGDGFAISFGEGESLELSQDALDFLQKIYAFAQRSADQKQSSMAKLFEPAPQIPLLQFKSNDMSLQRFIYLWHLFAVLDYKKCYRALLYIGYDKKLQNCFNLTLNKKKYSNLLKIKDRSTYNVLVVDGGEMRGTVAQLFQESVEEGPITRNVHVYSGEKVSKVVNVFMIAQKHFSSFVKEDQLALKQPIIYLRIDLVLYMESESLTQKSINQLLPLHTMRKQISHEIAHELSTQSLDLTTIPVSVKKHPKQKWLAYIVTLFHNIDEAYPEEYLSLKEEENTAKKVFIGIASTVALGFLGFAAFQYKRNK